MLTAQVYTTKLLNYQSEVELKKYHRYFKFDEDLSTPGDKFVGVRMGQVFELAKEFTAMPVEEIEKLLESPIHELRAGGCSIMGKSASAKKATEARRRELYDLYLRRHDRINDWDLVDLAAHKVVGPYLYDFKQPRQILYDWAVSKDTWERRSAIVSTFAFISRGELDDTFQIAEMLLKDDQDLVHKATGWALRAAGVADRPRLEAFLQTHGATMPRITLRNAIEHFSREERDQYLQLGK